MTDAPAVVFIGPMGAGKSSIGRRVARRLGTSFVDTDAVIVRDHGPIAEIFTARGETEFRALERAAVREAVSAGGVVALGGGAVMADETQRILADHRVILLTVSEKTVASRLRGAKRPLLNQGDPIAEWRRITAERMPVYERLADRVFDTSRGPLRLVVDEAARWASDQIGVPLAGDPADIDDEERA